VVRAVIFDFYGTLARFAHAHATGYEPVFTAFGYAPDAALLEAYFSRYDGIDHAEHSVDEAAYESWVRQRLRWLVLQCGVDLSDADDLVDALRAADNGSVVAYPEAADTLASLRAAGLAVGVCSNWGWELDAFLEEAGLLHLVDVGITSARAGARKPHPGIYAQAVDALGVEPAETVFVGDSWEPDVRGPRRFGMTAVHVWRTEERGGSAAPPLEPGEHRVDELSGVLDLVGLDAAPRSPLNGPRT
jgi:putative hydrolase of the HAD superfamily